MTTVQTSATTIASAAAVWRLWSDVENSPAWDTDVAWSRLDGEFEPGAHGEFKLKRGPSLRFVIDEVADDGYANTVRVPGLRVRFTHVFEQVAPGKLRITHGAELGGGLGWLAAPLLRHQLERAMAIALDNFVQLAERSSQEEAS